MKTNVDVKTIALQHAIKTLNSVGAKYKIIAEDGSEYGTLVLGKQPKRQLEFPMGQVREYYLPFIKDMKAGQVAKIPAGVFGLERIQGGVGAYASQTWGKKSVVTHQDEENGVVEVLRIY